MLLTITTTHKPATDLGFLLQKALDRGINGAKSVLEKFGYKKTAITKYIKAYRNYCWSVNSVEDYKLAPFHILATEGAVHVERLKHRGLARKRSLALREFALGIEALERFVGKEPLRSVHESVFGVLASSTEKVDPRL